MSEAPTCPRCGSEVERDEVDVGVGYIYGPYGCMCGWSEDPEYDCSDGPNQASLRHGYHVDSMGNLYPTIPLDSDEE